MLAQLNVEEQAEAMIWYECLMEAYCRISCEDRYRAQFV
jgi:hypothetical protein